MNEQFAEYKKNMKQLDKLYDKQRKLENKNGRILKSMSDKLLKHIYHILEEDRLRQVEDFERRKNIKISRDYLNTIVGNLYIKEINFDYVATCMNFIEAQYFSYGKFNYERKLHFDITGDEWKDMDFDNLDKYVFYFDENDTFKVRTKTIGEEIIDNI